LSSGYYRKETNWDVVSSFLVQQRLDVTDETFYTGICRIPAATAFELDLCGHYNEWRYWSLTNLPHNELGDPPKRFIELFEDAVDLRMRSDVPVGVCLSGGLDSTSIICSMVRTRSSIANQFCDPVWAFCYMTPEFDESRYIRDTLAQTNANLVKLEVNALHLLPKLERILWYHDEPFHTMTALIGYELMRLAAERGVKVVLSGQGADETLAGYSHYFQHYWATVVTTKGLRHAMKEVEEYTRRNGGDSKKLLAGVLLRILKGTLGQRAAYRAVAAWRRHREISRNSWYLPELLSIIPADGVAPDQELDTALRYSIEREHLPLYLRVEDRNSMAHSVEMRLPFMDYRLIAYLFQLSADWKIRGEWNKYILREAMRGRIPESVRMRRDKMGFPFPAQKWLEEGVCKSLLDLLEGQAMRERGIYDIKSIRKALEQRLTLEQNIPFEAFNVLQFEAWCQLSKSYSPEQAGCMAPATVDASGGAHAQE
jgi:asparagine synthase (glutamine-hydrolysing)